MNVNRKNRVAGPKPTRLTAPAPEQDLVARVEVLESIITQIGEAAEQQAREDAEIVDALSQQLVVPKGLADQSNKAKSQ